MMKIFRLLITVSRTLPAIFVLSCVSAKEPVAAPYQASYNSLVVELNAAYYDRSRINFESTKTPIKSFDEFVKSVQSLADKLPNVLFVDCTTNPDFAKTIPENKYGLGFELDTIKRFGDRMPKVKEIGDGIMCITLPEITTSSVSHLSEHTELRKAKGIILDLHRGDAGTFEGLVELCSLFLEKGRILEVQSRTGNTVTRKVITLSQDSVRADTSDFYQHQTKTYPRKFQQPFVQPLLVIIGQATSGAGELTSACLKDNKRATLIGVKTQGHGVGSTMLKGHNWLLVFGKYKYFRPDGTWIGDFDEPKNSERLDFGIKPDTMLGLEKGTSSSIDLLTMAKLALMKTIDER